MRRAWFATRRLPSASALTVLILCLTGIAAFALTRLSGEGSIAIEAATESVTVTSGCLNTPLDLTLPSGTLRGPNLFENSALKDEPVAFANPISVRVTGEYTLRIRRHSGGPLEVSFNAARLNTTSSDTGWSLAVTEHCPNDVCKPDAVVIGERRDLESVLYVSLSEQEIREAGATVSPSVAAVSLPISGIVQLGEHPPPSESEGGVARGPHYPLLGGAIKIRIRDWFNRNGRIEMDEAPLDLGDVVLTHAKQQSFKEDDKHTCLAKLAHGFVRPDPSTSGYQALQVIVGVDKDSVRLDRGVVGISVGPSVIDQVVRQPVVTLAWQVSVVLFGLLGFIFGIHELIGAARSGDSSPAQERSRFFHRRPKE